MPRFRKAEADDIVNLLKSQSADRQQLAEIAAIVPDCGFLPADAAAITECVGECMTSTISSAPPADGKFQRYESGVRYVPEGMWQRLSETLDPDEVLSFYVRLGCRKPNEDTTGALGLMVPAVTEGWIAHVPWRQRNARTFATASKACSRRRTTGRSSLMF